MNELVIQKATLNTTLDRELNALIMVDKRFYHSKKLFFCKLCVYSYCKATLVNPKPLTMSLFTRFITTTTLFLCLFQALFAQTYITIFPPELSPQRATVYDFMSVRLVNNAIEEYKGYFECRVYRMEQGNSLVIEARSNDFKIPRGHSVISPTDAPRILKPIKADCCGDTYIDIAEKNESLNTGAYRICLSILQNKTGNVLSEEVCYEHVIESKQSIVIPQKDAFKESNTIKLPVNVKATGRTTGTIAIMTVTNLSKDIVKQTIGPFLIPSHEGYQGYIVPDKYELSIPPTSVISVDLKGYCTDIHLPPVPAENPMINFSKWISESQMKPLPKAGVRPPEATGFELIVENQGKEAPNILFPGGDGTFPYTLDISLHPEYAAPLILKTVKDLRTTYQTLQAEGKLLTPFQNKPQKELEAVVQQSLWRYTAALQAKPYTLENFKNHIAKRNVVKNWVKEHKKTEKGKRYEQEVENWWAIFEKTGHQAGAFTVKSPTPYIPVSKFNEIWDYADLIGPRTKFSGQKDKKFPIWVPITLVGVAGGGTAAYFLSKKEDPIPPIAVNDILQANCGATELTINVLENDQGVGLTLSSFDAAPFGTTVTDSGNGNLTISNISSESFSIPYEITDTNGLQANATLQVNVNVGTFIPLMGTSAGACYDTTTVMVTNCAGCAYIWNTGDTTEWIIVTESGEYCVDVTNQSGCTGSACFTLPPSQDFSIDIEGVGSFCEGATESLSAVTDCTNCVFLWDTGDQTQNIEITTGGEYCVEATAPNACVFVACKTVELLEQVEFEYNVGCADLSTNIAPLEITPINGTAPFEVSVNGEAFMPFTSGESLNILNVGESELMIQDALGCTSEMVTVTALETVTFEGTISCPDIDNSGISTLIIVPSGGLAPYQISLDNGNSYHPPGQTEFEIEYDSSPTITVKIRDANGCESTSEIFEVESLITVLVEQSCVEDGLVTLTINLPIGVEELYAVTVNGSLMECGDYEVEVPANMTSTITLTACFGMNCESAPLSIQARDVITLTVEQDCPIYNIADQTSSTLAHFTVTSEDPTFISINGEDIGMVSSTSLSPGTHEIVATDAAGCTASQTIEVITNESLIYETDLSTPLVCGEGSVTVVVSSSATTYNWFLDADLTIPALPATNTNTYTTDEIFGERTLWVQGTDDNGCTTTIISIPIYHYAPNAGTLTLSSNIICFNDSITASSTDFNTADNHLQTYIVTNSTSTIVAVNSSGLFNNLPSGSFTVWGLNYGAFDFIIPTVGDSISSLSGCFALSSGLPFTVLNEITITATPICNDTLGGWTVRILITGGTPELNNTGAYNLNHVILNTGTPILNWESDMGGASGIITNSDGTGMLTPFPPDTSITLTVSDAFCSDSILVTIPIDPCGGFKNSPSPSQRQPFSIVPNQRIHPIAPISLANPEMPPSTPNTPIDDRLIAWTTHNAATVAINYSLHANWQWNSQWQHTTGQVAWQNSQNNTAIFNSSSPYTTRANIQQSWFETGIRYTPLHTQWQPFVQSGLAWQHDVLSNIYTLENGSLQTYPNAELRQNLLLPYLSGGLTMPIGQQFFIESEGRWYWLNNSPTSPFEWQLNVGWFLGNGD